MKQAIPLRTPLLWFGFALLVGIPGCAEVAPGITQSSAIPESGEPPAPFSSDDLEDAELSGDEFDFGADVAPNDPFEGTNRALLSFNQGLARRVFDPMIRGYRFAVPESARRGVHRAFVNLKAPSTLINDLLQLRFMNAAETLGRFLLNTTVGFGGIFDVAIEAGWQHHEADFGQTLARLGVASGPYLVLPVFGPNTIRDGFGGVIDLFFQPLTYLIGPAQNLVIGVSSGFTTLDAHDSSLKALEESSVDYYAALRSAYLQNRAAHIAHP
jgi:phospholipid-binding lipoprotein MlaA